MNTQLPLWSESHRDSVEPRYDLIPMGALRRIALTFAEGAKHYGDRNWEKGMPYSVMVNHLMEHLAKLSLIHI